MMNKKGRAEKPKKAGGTGKKKKKVAASEAASQEAKKTPSMRPSAPPIAMREDVERRSRPSRPLELVAAPSLELVDSSDDVDARSDHEELDERQETEFFESRSDLSQLADDEEEAPAPPRSMSPVAVARRAQYRKYVKGVMAICGGVIVLGLVSAAVHRAGGDEPTASAHVAQAQPPSKPPAVETAPPQAPPPPPPVTATATEPPAPPVEPPPPPATATAPAVTAAPVEKAIPAVATPEPPKAVETTGRTALEEKRDAQRFLERAKWPEAIAAGERSVAIDPSDGEAWLFLGAAYQSAGKLADARRAYSSCLKEGKKGPLSECRAMLR